jgi:hypothetical protein
VERPTAASQWASEFGSQQQAEPPHVAAMGANGQQWAAEFGSQEQKQQQVRVRGCQCQVPKGAQNTCSLGKMVSLCMRRCGGVSRHDAAAAAILFASCHRDRNDEHLVSPSHCTLTGAGRR